MKLDRTNRTPYASDGMYQLYALTKADKDAYIKLQRENDKTPGFYDDPIKVNILWQLAIDGSEYTICDLDGNYCGNLILKKPQTASPEIGIDIVKKHQNKGIGPRAIKMFACAYYKEQSIAYFLIRVSSENLHSKHIVEKLGCIKMEDTSDFYRKRIQDIKDIMGQEAANAYIKMRKESPDIYHYKYLPEVFLN